jgi:hypothetical protein
MAMKTRSIKVSERAHQQLKTLAAKYDAHVWEIVDMAVVAFKVAERAKNGGRVKDGKR